MVGTHTDVKIADVTNKRFKRRSLRRSRREGGQGILEYSLVLALIAVVVVAVVIVIGKQANASLTTVCNGLSGQSGCTLGAAPVLVQDVPWTSTGAQNATAITLATPPVAGDLLVIAIDDSYAPASNGIAVATVTDNANPGWSSAVAKIPGSVRVSAEIWYLPGTLAGVTTVTVTFAGGNALSSAFHVYEFRGVGTLDQVSPIVANASGSTAAPGAALFTPTTTANSEAVVGTMSINNNGCCATTIPLAGLQYYDAAQHNTVLGQSGYSLTTSAGAQNFTGTISSTSWAEVIATFK